MTTPWPNRTLILQPGKQTTVKIQPGQHIKVAKAAKGADSPAADPSDLQTPDNLIATRQGGTLHVRYADGSVVNFEDFYSTCKDANVCSVNLAGDTEAGTTLSADMTAGNVEVTGSDAGTLVYAHGGQDTLYAMAQDQAALQATFGALGDAPVLTYLPQAIDAAAADHMVGAAFATLAGLVLMMPRGHDSGDTTPPTVSSISISSATGAQNHILNAGDVVQVTVVLSEVTLVTGTPTVGLNIGSNVVQATYVSGSGSNTLVFSYTIQPGQNDSNGISIAPNSLTLNGDTLKDSSGNSAILAHSAQSDDANYLVDTTAPTVTITSSASALRIGQTATISFTFSEDPGSTFVASDITTTGGTLGPLSGSGLTRTAVFTPSASLASGSASITVAAGSYADAAGNGGVAGTTPVIAIDTVAPTLAISSNASTLHAGQTANITFTFSEDPGSSFVASDIVTTGGTLGALSGSGLTRTAVFTPTANLASGNASITVAAGNYTDAAGNSGGAGTTPAIAIDTLVPTLTITSDVSAVRAGQTANITFTFSEDPGISFTASDIVTTGGSLSTLSGSGLTRTAVFTPSANLASGNASITVAAGSYTDAAGNGGGAGNTPAISIETLSPAVSSVAISSATGVPGHVLYTGDEVFVTVTMSEATTVTGTPTLDLTIGSSVVQASYVSGSGSNALVFGYTIVYGQVDSNGISIAANSLALAGGTLKDAAGNSATLTHSAVTDNFSYLVDTTALSPVVSLAFDTGASNTDRVTNNGALVVNGAMASTAGSVGSSFYTTGRIMHALDNGNSGEIPAQTSDLVWATADSNFARFLTLPATSTDGVRIHMQIGSTFTEQVNIINTNLTSILALPTGSTADFVYSAVQGKWIYEGSVGFLGVQYSVDGGAYSPYYVAPTTDGVHTVLITQTDVAGHVSAPYAYTFTLNSAATGTPAVVPTQFVAITNYTDDVGSGAGVGNFATRTSTDDTTPVLNGTLSAALLTGEQLQIYDGGTLLGNATVTGTTWTYAPSTLLDGSTHNYFARVLNSAGNVGTAANLILYESSPYERLTNPTISGSATGWTMTQTLIPTEVTYFQNAIDFNSNGQPAGGSAYQTVTNLIVGQSYTVQYELGELTNAGTHTMLAKIVDGTVWNAGTQLASQTYTQTTFATTLHSFTFTATSSTATLVFTNTSSPVTTNTDITLEQASIMTTDEAARHAATPLVLDLNGDGVQTVALNQGVSFDVANTGTANQTAWVSKADGLLVCDINHDGLINNGAELFGQGTLLADGSHAANGFQALAQFDANHDGKIDAKDAVFKELLVWRDANGDGVSQAGELLSMQKLGIVSFNLNASTGYAVEHGNLHGLVSSYTTQDGVVHDLTDVWFQQAVASKAQAQQVM